MVVADPSPLMMVPSNPASFQKPLSSATKNGACLPVRRDKIEEEVNPLQRTASLRQRQIGREHNAHRHGSRQSRDVG